MHRETHNNPFEATEGMALLGELRADPNNIVLHGHEAELENMTYWDMETQWPTVVGNNGSVTITVPQAGSFYIGAVVYDTEEKCHLPHVTALLDCSPGTASYELSIDGKTVGRFQPHKRDNRERLFFLDRPIAFKGGEMITLHTGPEGRHLVQDILLLYSRPPIRRRSFAISHVAADSVEIDGKLKARLTWVTSWPSRCKVDYGTNQPAVEPEPLSNHRLILEDVEAGQTIKYRIRAPKPDGGEVQSDEMTLTVSSPARPGGNAICEKVTLRVQNPHDFDIDACPVSSGVPFGRGEIGTLAQMRLLDSTGTPIVMQAQELARWDDGSIKWALVSFQAEVLAKETGIFALEYGKDVSPSEFNTPLQVQQEDGAITVNTGPLEVRFDASRSGFPIRCVVDGKEVIADPVQATLSAEGKTFDSHCPAELLEIEEAGPVRVVIHSKGHYQETGGGPFFEYEARFVFYANAPFFQMHHAWGNDREELFTTFDQIRLDIPLVAGKDSEWAVGLGEGRSAVGSGDLDLRQMRHDHFEMTPQQPGGRQCRADGWVDMRCGDGGLLVSVRDFWQLYPKSLSINDGRLSVGLCPDFPDGTYDQDEADDITQFYFYLLEGRYKIKTGLKKWHELLFFCHENELGAEAQLQTVAAFQNPLIAVCPAEHYCGTGVFGKITPAGTGKTDRYDQLCDQLAERYEKRRRDNNWYGMLNYGCVVHEGMLIWENGEYDHHHGFLLLFARTADLKWYFLAEKAARHFIDVDTVHYGPHNGVVYAHEIGHTGDYFDTPPTPYPKDHRLRALWGCPSHSWLEGFCDWYGVSGDRTSLEAARNGGDYYCGAVLMNNYEFTNLREVGWFIILALGVYNLTYDPCLLNGARIAIKRVLEKQTPGPRGWHRQMIPAHCHCLPRHRGACLYMLSITCRGLETYYEITGDQRVADAIVGGANQAIDEMWIEEKNDFAPTSCPHCKEFSNWSGQYPHPIQMLLFSHRRTGKSRYLDIAKKLIEHSSRSNEDMAPFWTKGYYHLEQIEKELNTRETKHEV